MRLFYLFTDGKEYFCEKHNDIIYNQSCNVSFSSLTHIQLNVPEPLETRDNTAFPDSDEDYPTENHLNQTDFSHTKPIIIETDYTKHDKFNETDSANHSFDDGVDVIDGIVKPEIKNETDKIVVLKKFHANSVDSGISNNMNGTNGNVGCTENGIDHLNGIVEKVKSLPSRLSDLSLKETEHNSIKDVSSDEDKFGSDQDVSPRIKMNGTCNGTENKNGVSLNLKLQSEMR